jgi:hypothetical protein
MVTSFYTPGTQYEAHGERLRKECRELGIPSFIQPVEDAGGYLANCRQKPQFILSALRRLNVPLLWVDVDASVLWPPGPFPDGVEFMASRKRASAARHWHVGTLFFRPTPGAGFLLREWIAELAADSDEAALERAWPRCRDEVSWAVLPAPYFFVHNRRRKTPRGTIIMHRLSEWPNKTQYTRKTVRRS